MSDVQFETAPLGSAMGAAYRKKFPGETMSTNFNQNDESRMEKTSLPLRKRTPENFFGIFAVAMALSLAVFSIFCLIGGICQFTSLFLLHGDDLFMDFFNSIRDVSQGTGVYTERHVIYPPMANLIFLICMRFVPEEYASTSFEDRESWANYPSAVLVCFLFLFVFTILLLLALQKNLPGHGGKKAVLVFFLIVNPPVLYLLERANLLLLSILSLAVYALYYNAGQKWKRELALLALAFSFSIKLYPAVFGWFLIVDKRYKEAIRCILYGIAMFLIPSFFFGGPVSIFWTFENIFSYSTGTNGWNRLASFLNISESAVKLIFLPLLFLLAAAFVASAKKSLENMDLRQRHSPRRPFITLPLCLGFPPDPPGTFSLFGKSEKRDKLVVFCRLYDPLSFSPSIFRISQSPNDDQRLCDDPRRDPPAGDLSDRHASSCPFLFAREERA